MGSKGGATSALWWRWWSGGRAVELNVAPTSQGV